MNSTSDRIGSAPERWRSACYGLVGHGFRYPDAQLFRLLADPERWLDWPEALRRADSRAGDRLNQFRAVLTPLTEHCDGWPPELQHRYDELFGHAVRGRCPAYEMEYGQNEIIRQASDLADVAGFYGAFGLESANGTNGRPDHIAAECEFMSALCSKETYATIQGDTANAEICLDAQRAFLRDHLARWLPAFAHHVVAADSDGLFGALARFADAFVKAECSRFDIHAGPATLELRSPDPVLDTQISCGTAGCGEGDRGQQIVQLGLNTARSGDREKC